MIKRKWIAALLVVGCLLMSGSVAIAQSALKVACVGNSITEGVGLEITYPEALQVLMGENYEVRNFGISSRTLLKKGNLPYWQETKYEEVLAWNPDIVIIKLGTNDSKPQNWEYKNEFVKGYIALIRSFENLPSEPQVFVCYPIPVFEDKWGITEAVVQEEILPAVEKAARKADVKAIDLYTPFLGQPHLTYDGIHPNVVGAALLANEVYKAMKAAEVLAEIKSGN